MKSISGPLFTVIVFIAVQLCVEAEGRRHRHSHRRHQLQSEEQRDQNSTGNMFLPAYRNNENSEVSEEDGTSTGSETSPNPNSMERRLETLEQNVRYLCLEDEDDVDRRIRVLGVKCVCPKTEAPVCGSDNVTYYNRCFLHCRAQQALTSFHRYRITLKKFGPC